MTTKPTRQALITELGIQLGIPQGTNLLMYLHTNYEFIPKSKAQYMFNKVVYISKVEHSSLNRHIFNKLRCVFSTEKQAIEFAIYIVLRYIVTHGLKSKEEIEAEEAKKADEEKRRKARELAKLVIPKVSTESNESPDLLRDIQRRRRFRGRNFLTSRDIFNYCEEYLNENTYTSGVYYFHPN